MRVAGGEYRALYGGAGGERVRPFFLDEVPVTNADFLAFVRANPQWRRSRVRPLFVTAALFEQVEDMSKWLEEINENGGESESNHRSRPDRLINREYA